MIMRGKRFASLLLVGVLCFGMVAECDAANASKAREKAEAAEKEEEEAKAKKKKVESETGKLKDEKEAAEAEKEKLAKELDEILADMEELQDKIDAKEAEIEVIEEKLIQAQVDENDQYEAMKLRIKYMYENGDAQMLEILFDATSISDFLNKAEYISSVSDYDREKLEEYTRIVEEVQAQEDALQKEYDELEELQDELLDKQDSLEDLIATKEGEISEIEDEISDNEDKIKELEEAAKTAARKKQEAQATLAASSGGSSGAGAAVVSGNGTFTHPCPGYTRISSTFGYRTAPKAGASTYHKGVDFAAPQGTPIYAADAGTVTSASYSGNAGNLIVINHGNGLQTYYMHCYKMYVSAGQKVSRGQNIGLVGTTGNSTGPHLHFQVMKNGTAVNPLSYL